MISIYLFFSYTNFSMDMIIQNIYLIPFFRLDRKSANLRFQYYTQILAKSYKPRWQLI